MTVSLSISPRRDCAPLPGSARLAGSERRSRLNQDDSWEILLARANDGDGAAFARFLIEVTPALRAAIRRRGEALPADMHEDVLQEVLLAIHLKRHTWRRADPVRPWLYALARYKVADAFRRRGTTVNLPIEDFAEVLPEETTVIPMVSRDTEVMLAQIDSRSARLVRAVALEGKSAKEAGEALGLNSGAARVALHRAMKRLTDAAERMRK